MVVLHGRCLQKEMAYFSNFANATVDRNLHSRCQGCYKGGISDIWIIRYLDEKQVKEEGK